MPITTPAELRDHLEIALEVELSTIPPYLYAMYSIADQSSEAALLIRSIVAEEMLHAALVSNLLLAVGGRPRFDTTDHIPKYPGALPHHTPPLILELAPASEKLIRDVFMRIEQPEVHDAPAEADDYETLGQFYHAMEIAIEELSLDLFADPQREHQLSDPSFYRAIEYDADDSGGLMLVDDVQSAVAAIEVIVHQGEGLSTDKWADPSHQELTHYHKLLQIADGTSPLGHVLPLRTNPRITDFPDDVRPVADLFNLAYRYTFMVMHELFGPAPDKGSVVGRLYGQMSTVMSTLARFLVTRDLGDGTVAAPTFEVVPIDDPLEQLVGEARSVTAQFPELGEVVAAVDKMTG